MSGPDRFDAQARELVCKVDGMIYGHSDDERAAVIAAALRKAESSALERAAEAVEHRYYGVPPYEAVRAIRALIPPAAAPAAETGKVRCPFDEQDCLDARQLLRECEDALSTVGCHPGGEALAQAVLKKLRARAAPTKETT